jgi:hypothetical protein
MLFSALYPIPTLLLFPDVIRDDATAFEPTATLKLLDLL